jgi:hypothetical protein
LDDTGVNSQTPKHPDQLWGPPILYSVGTRDPSPWGQWPGHESDHSPPSQTEFNNKHSDTSTPPICLHIINRGMFICLSPYSIFIYCLGKKLITLTITNVRCPLYSCKVGHTLSEQYYRMVSLHSIHNILSLTNSTLLTACMILSCKEILILNLCLEFLFV